MANADTKEIVQGDAKISFQTETWAEQANASCLVQLGDTVVLVTAVMSPKDTDRDYFPLMVDFEEKFYAAGRILGSRFVRREGRPSDESVISARIIDRALRPRIPGFSLALPPSVAAPHHRWIGTTSIRPKPIPRP